MADLPTRTASASLDSASSAAPAQGVALALGATCFWSMFPLLFKTVVHIDPLEVLAHRSVWSLVFALLIMTVIGRREIFARSFYVLGTVRVAVLSGLAIAVNWGIFIWAVAHDQVLQSSLGYYISPLVSVLLGVAFLRERLPLRAWMAVGLAAAGVTLLVWRFGEVPWVALTLAFSWAFYGLIRKLSPLGSLPGLYLETLLLLPVALGYIVWLGVAHQATFGATLDDTLLLTATGAATALPLLLFARATRILRLSTIGVLMYIVPTGQFLLAVFAFGEPFTLAHLWAFALIWAGLALYGWDTVHQSRRTRAGRAAAQKAKAETPNVPLA